MNILFATSEAVPFAKTGGLADVCGALPIELARLGHQPAVILPAYRKSRYCGQPIEPLGIDFIVPIGSKMVTGHLLQSAMPGGDVPVYLVQQDQYFDRDELYGVDGKDYVDNCERFVFFSRAVLEAIRLLDLHVDVMHANDWQTGLVPAYLKIEYRRLPRYQRIASLFTIHNLAYQGQFWHWDMLLTGLDWKYFNWHQMEFHGKLNLLKTGLVFADSISTVSPRYAQEIQSSPLGCGLEGVLQHRRDVLSGILNGIDAARVGPGHRSAPGGQLRRRHGRPRASRPARRPCRRNWGCRGDPPSRWWGSSAGLPIRRASTWWPRSCSGGCRRTTCSGPFWAPGDPKYHKLLETLADRFPQQGGRCGWSSPTPLAHRIEAGADMFLMPSRFEPCGLNQLYSLRYGTVPVVRATGGLADTIVGFNPQTPNAGGQRVRFPRVQRAGAERDAAPGLRGLSPAGGVEAACRHRHAAGLVVGPQRESSTSSCIGRRWSAGKRMDIEDCKL